MPDVTATVNDLEGASDQALQSELMNPSGAAPAYLVLSRGAKRRQLMRQSAVTEQNKQPIGSVYDDVIRSMMARQPPLRGRACRRNTPALRAAGRAADAAEHPGRRQGWRKAAR